MATASSTWTTTAGRCPTTPGTNLGSRRLLDAHPHIVVAGTAENQGRLYGQFEHVVLLSAPLEVLLRRVVTRTNNPYGRRPEERADIARYVRTVEPLLRAGADVELDGTLPVEQLADTRRAARRTALNLWQRSRMSPPDGSGNRKSHPRRGGFPE